MQIDYHRQSLIFDIGRTKKLILMLRVLLGPKILKERQSSQFNLSISFEEMDGDGVLDHAAKTKKHLEIPGNTLPETNSLPLKMDGWNTSLLLGWPIFRGYVSFRECTSYQPVGSDLPQWHAHHSLPCRQPIFGSTLVFETRQETPSSNWRILPTRKRGNKKISSKDIPSSGVFIKLCVS